MIYLFLNTQLRAEDDSTVIENLLRKGWQEAPPKPDPNATWDGSAWIPSPPAPDYKIWPNVQAFMAEFTMEEKAVVAVSTDPVIAALRLELTTWMSDVHGNDPRVSMGLNRLVELGVLSSSRKTEILALS